MSEEQYEIIDLENGFTRNQSRTSKFITEARSNMTALELKAFYQLTTLINADDEVLQTYEISIKDFTNALGLHIDDRTNIKNLCKKLLKQDFILDYTHENGDWDLIRINIFNQFSYKAKEQKLVISFGEKIKPYLLQLKERFTKIENVAYITSFRSKYAIRIYALLKDYRKMTYRDFELEPLKRVLGVEPKKPKKGEEPKKSTYDNYNNLYKKILEPAMKEINEKSDLYISAIEEIKKERKKVLKIRIHFENQGKRMAEHRIKLLLEHYEKHKKDWGFKVFKGYKYFQNDQIRTITEIKQEVESNYHALYCDNSDLVSFSCHDGKTFLNRLCNGIMDAVEIYAEKDKSSRLGLYDWQEEQNKIEIYKEIIRSWFEKK